MLTPELVLEALKPRIGSANGITARELANALTGIDGAGHERQLRDVIVHLRMQGHPICAHPTIGYFWAANEAELDDACEFLHGRAMTSLAQVAAMKRVAIPDLRGQLGLPLSPDTTTDADHEPA